VLVLPVPSAHPPPLCSPPSTRRRAAINVDPANRSPSSTVDAPSIRNLRSTPSMLLDLCSPPSMLLDLCSPPSTRPPRSPSIDGIDVDGGSARVVGGVASDPGLRAPARDLPRCPRPLSPEKGTQSLKP
jgi:hypothetical protein